ncbi:preprotein translocase subunit SecG [Filifactor villosus]|uniref:Protein-export membrane protein SecG n=1 Tax=Filifactor villosus TaxID=29374 RepID=A0ABV9QP57_9FIRM
MRNFLMVLEILVSIALIATVMLQSGSNASLGFMGGVSEQLSGNKVRGKETVLRKVTVVLAVVFLILAVVLLALQK